MASVVSRRPGVPVLLPRAALALRLSPLLRLGGPYQPVPRHGQALRGPINRVMCPRHFLPSPLRHPGLPLARSHLRVRPLAAFIERPRAHIDHGLAGVGSLFAVVCVLLSRESAILPDVGRSVPLVGELFPLVRNAVARGRLVTTSLDVPVALG